VDWLGKLWHLFCGFVILGGDLVILAGFVKFIVVFCCLAAGFVVGCEWLEICYE